MISCGFELAKEPQSRLAFCSLIAAAVVGLPWSNCSARADLADVKWLLTSRWLPDCTDFGPNGGWQASVDAVGAMNHQE
jgi:hypothetical protein